MVKLVWFLTTGWPDPCWGDADGLVQVSVLLFGSLWLCCRRRYEVLLLQLLLRAGKEGRIQSTWSERPVLLLQQLQRKKPGLQSQHLLELLLSPPPVLVLAPLAEADMRGKNKVLKQQVCLFREG